MTGNVQEYPDGDNERHERRASITHERQGDAGKRYDVEIDAHVDERLNQNPCRNSNRHVFCKGIVHPARYSVTAVRDVAIARNEHHYSDEPQFFGDYGKNEVPLHFGQVSELLNRFPETQSEEASTTDSYEPLFGLEVDRLVRYGRLVVG